jgi:hypothetical protein
MTSTPAPPPPRATPDRIASDLADARRAARREVRLGIVVEIAQQFVAECREAPKEHHAAISADYRDMVDALEAIAEPANNDPREVE